jgi:hypothetical protein
MDTVQVVSKFVVDTHFAKFLMEKLGSKGTII